MLKCHDFDQERQARGGNNLKIDWSSLWKKEDWWAVWIGFIILLLGIAKWLPALPKIDKWGADAGAFPAGLSTVLPAVLLFVLLFVLTLIGIVMMGKNIRYYLPGFLVVFCMAFIAMWVGKYAVLTQWGLETVLWALFIGLIVGFRI